MCHLGLLLRVHHAALVLPAVNDQVMGRRLAGRLLLVLHVLRVVIVECASVWLDHIHALGRCATDNIASSCLNLLLAVVKGVGLTLNVGLLHRWWTKRTTAAPVRLRLTVMLVLLRILVEHLAGAVD